jgi:hypothetical protein
MDHRKVGRWVLRQLWRGPEPELASAAARRQVLLLAYDDPLQPRRPSGRITELLWIIWVLAAPLAPFGTWFILGGVLALVASVVAVANRRRRKRREARARRLIGPGALATAKFLVRNNSLLACCILAPGAQRRGAFILLLLGAASDLIREKVITEPSTSGRRRSESGAYGAVLIASLLGAMIISTFALTALGQIDQSLGFGSPAFIELRQAVAVLFRGVDIGRPSPWFDAHLRGTVTLGYVTLLCSILVPSAFVADSLVTRRRLAPAPWTHLSLSSFLCFAAVSFYWIVFSEVKNPTHYITSTEVSFWALCTMSFKAQAYFIFLILAFTALFVGPAAVCELAISRNAT